MARRRLHGVTQARRRKPETRQLKLQDSIARSRGAERREGFERQTAFDREDLEFLEAMKELAVQRVSWSREAPQRREAFEQVQFQAADEGDALFHRAMDALGVEPLEGGGGEGVSTSSGAVPAAPQPAPTAQTPTGRSGAASGQNAAAPQPADTPRNRAAGRAGQTQHNGTAPGTRFEEESDAARLMEALLGDPAQKPELKFAGADAPPDQQPRSKKSHRARAPDPERLEPDDSLDLHGQTREAAIRMVANFLLQCRRARCRHVLIITGRGQNSGAEGPVLRDAVYHWLERNAGSYVRAFDWAPPRHGGPGALWVTLR